MALMFADLTARTRSLGSGITSGPAHKVMPSATRTEPLRSAGRAPLTSQRDPTLLRSDPQAWLSERATVHGSPMERDFILPIVP